ncbi:MAG: hypothetical protein ACTSQY_02655 [Candidatus Odinarchaeia archaeon]
MQLFHVLGDGELVEIKSKKTIREHLKSDSVFLVIDDDKKRIWIWKGANAPVREKFISARAATQIREERGLMYKVNSEDEGDESDVFLKAIGETPKPRPEIKAPALKSTASSTPAATTPTVRKEPPPAPRRAPSAAPVREQAASRPSPSKQPDYEAIIKKLDEIGVPHGFERELVIVGSEVFTMVEQTTQFLGKKQMAKKLERAPMGTVPEGVFLAEDYTPRVIVDNGNVMAIEFLKQAKAIDIPDDSEKASSLKNEMKYHLSDLVDYFQIEITEDEKKKKGK